MTMTLEHAPVEEYSDDDDNERRLCACGCGELLREGAKRAFLRGHKSRGESVDPDPEPGEEAQKRVVRATARIKKEMQETIEAYLAMAASAWALSDPICGSIIIESAPRIAEKLVPILSKNQTFIKYFRGGNSFKEGMDLILVLLPVIRTIAAHHLFHSIGQADTVPVPDYNGYVA